MPTSQISYSEYKSILDIAQSPNQDNSYQELMKKEENTLNTVNNVIKYYQDRDIKSKQFVNLSFYEMAIRMTEIWTDIYSDILNWKDTKNNNIMDVIFKEDRSIFIGIFLIITSFFLFFIIISD